VLAGIRKGDGVTNFENRDAVYRVPQEQMGTAAEFVSVHCDVKKPEKHFVLNNPLDCR
jgi:hypothetical protein